jgi:hypothetical protein
VRFSHCALTVPSQLPCKIVTAVPFPRRSTEQPLSAGAEEQPAGWAGLDWLQLSPGGAGASPLPGCCDNAVPDCALHGAGSSVVLTGWHSNGQHRRMAITPVATQLPSHVPHEFHFMLDSEQKGVPHLVLITTYTRRPPDRRIAKPTVWVKPRIWVRTLVLALVRNHSQSNVVPPFKAHSCWAMLLPTSRNARASALPTPPYWGMAAHLAMVSASGAAPDAAGIGALVRQAFGAPGIRCSGAPGHTSRCQGGALLHAETSEDWQSGLAAALWVETYGSSTHPGRPL